MGRDHLKWVPVWALILYASKAVKEGKKNSDDTYTSKPTTMLWGKTGEAFEMKSCATKKKRGRRRREGGKSHCSCTHKPSSHSVIQNHWHKKAAYIARFLIWHLPHFLDVGLSVPSSQHTVYCTRTWLTHTNHLLQSPKISAITLMVFFHWNSLSWKHISCRGRCCSNP